MSYTSVDDVARAVFQLGKGSLLAKVDIKEAYHMYLSTLKTDSL